MKIQTVTKRKVERTIAIHDDGAVSLAITARRLDARLHPGRDYWSLMDYSEVIDVPVSVGGTTMRPRLYVKLICKPSREALRKARLGEFARIRPRKPGRLPCKI